MRASRSSSEDEEPEDDDASVLVRLAVPASGAAAPKKMCEGAAIAASQSMRRVLKGSLKLRKPGLATRISERFALRHHYLLQGMHCSTAAVLSCQAAGAFEVRTARNETRDAAQRSGSLVMMTLWGCSVSFLQQLSVYFSFSKPHTPPPPDPLFFKFFVTCDQKSQNICRLHTDASGDPLFSAKRVVVAVLPVSPV